MAADNVISQEILVTKDGFKSHQIDSITGQPYVDLKVGDVVIIEGDKAYFKRELVLVKGDSIQTESEVKRLVESLTYYLEFKK